MKKIITLLTALFALVSFNALAIGFNVGGQLTTAYFETSGFENEAGEVSETKTGAAMGSYGSIFGEIQMDRFRVGVSYVPGDLETETAEQIRQDQKDGAANAAKTNKIKATLEDYTTAYVAVDITDHLYIKAGIITLDLITNENLETGSAYGNTDLDGNTFGAGYQTTLDNGIFIRGEFMLTEIGGTSLTSTSNSDNKVTINDVNGANASIQIGKAF